MLSFRLKNEINRSKLNLSGLKIIIIFFLTHEREKLLCNNAPSILCLVYLLLIVKRFIFLTDNCLIYDVCSVINIRNR